RGPADAARARRPRAPRLGPRARRVARRSPGGDLGRLHAGGGREPGGDRGARAPQARTGRQRVPHPHGPWLRLRPGPGSRGDAVMTPRSLTTRVLRGTVFVALATALAGAATATLIARGLWEAHERGALRDLAAGLAGAVERESAEEGGTLDAAVAEALRESVTAGQRAA